MENFYYLFSTHESIQSFPTPFQWSIYPNMAILPHDQCIHTGELISLRGITETLDRKMYALTKNGLIELPNKKEAGSVSILQLKNPTLMKIERTDLRL